MITVHIDINARPILARSAYNTGIVRDGKTVYGVDDGTEVLHDPKEGAVVLAKLLLDTIHEPEKGK